MLPEFSIGPFTSLPTYFLYLSLLVSFLFFLTHRWVQVLGQNVQVGLNLSLLIAVSGFIGGRLFHVFYEAWPYYRQFPSAIFMFWYGGYVFFGGMFLAGLSSALYLRWAKESFWLWFDILAPVLALGYGLGRFACFLAGCCYGSFCDFPWAVHGRHPTQLYALLIEVSISVVLFQQVRSTYLRKTRSQIPGQDLKTSFSAHGKIALLWLLLHGLGRLLMESYRDDFRGAKPFGLSISTWISLGLVAGALAGLTWQSYGRKGFPQKGSQDRHA